MTKEEFLNEMQDVLQTEETLTMSTQLKDLEEWDSLAIMATMAFLNNSFNIASTMKDYQVMTTIEDIATKAGVEK